MPGFGEKTAEVKLTGAKRREWMRLGVAGMICLIVSQWIIPFISVDSPIIHDKKRPILKALGNGD